MMRLSNWLPVAAMALVVSYLAMWWANRPVDVGPGFAQGEIQSLSFAPYRQGYSPLISKFPPAEHIEEDLRLLAGEVKQVRTYSSGEGLEKTHALAAELELTYLQGAWLTHNSSREGRAANQLEVKRLIKAANTYPQVVKRVVVGNEVLLRGDMPVGELVGYIKQVKAAVAQPVTYADVWSMYLKHPELIEAVDFITIHILPYWEDEPIPADKAANHLAAIVAEVRKQADLIAPGKPILIGETGWPSHGRQRGLAIPSVENQALYIRQVVRMAPSMGLQYNLVEAFNQPWKAQLEGVVGAYWGLWDAQRHPVAPLDGPVQQNPGWLMQWLAGVGVWVLAVALATGVGKPMVSGNKHWLQPVVCLGGAMLVAQVWSAYVWWQWQVAFDDTQQAKAVAWAGAGLVLVGLAAANMRGQAAGLRMGGVIEGPTGKLIGGLMGWLIMAYLAYAIWHTLQLAWAGRYLSFPNWQFALVIFTYLWLAAGATLRHGKLALAAGNVLGYSLPGPWRLRIAAALALAGMALLIGETHAFYIARDLVQVHADNWIRLHIALGYVVQNGQLMGWLAMLSLAAGVVWWRAK